ncbi:MAG TPA: alpha/beta hydrolase [Leptolyngbyaceae cyanobacterium]
MVARSTSKNSTWLGLVLSSLGWLLPNVVMTPSCLAAERIYFSYGAIERTISVASLEAYAKEGKIDDDLATYAEYVSAQRLIQLQRVLQARIQLSPVAVSQFLYTPVGETLLQRLGEVIQTEARQPGFYALRAALILAAADQDGLTLLSVLEKFPTRSVRIDLGRSLEIMERLEILIAQTREAIALVSNESAAATSQSQVNFSQLPDLRLPGRFSWNKQTLKLYDRRRNHTFFADIYIPQQERAGGAGGAGGAEEKIFSKIQNPKSKIQNPPSSGFPVIVISHGLGSDRTSFTYLAEQLASYGFAVAVPEHPGSNAKQLQSLLSGRANQVAEPNEFINRPLDVKYLLDELQRLDAYNLSFQLNFQQVGVIGQSFGGYTALALAGAKLNFKQLQTNCDEPNDIWNVSLLLQCRALDLPETDYNLQDPRVKAAIAINPIDSSIFGQAGLERIQVPVMIVGGSTDTVAPVLSEQILPFSWLDTAQKYLVVIERASHFSIIGETNPNQQAFVLPPQAIGPNPAIARRYMSALGVAFFQTYIAGNSQYRNYLSSAYVQAINQAPLNISLVQSLSITQLTQPALQRSQKVRSQEPKESRSRGRWGRNEVVFYSEP